MNESIQPKYELIDVVCSCGEKFQTRSTLCKSLSIEVCSECHPFYTGQQKVIDTGGRVKKFMDKYNRAK